MSERALASVGSPSPQVFLSFCCGKSKPVTPLCAAHLSGASPWPHSVLPTSAGQAGDPTLHCPPRRGKPVTPLCAALLGEHRQCDRERRKRLGGLALLCSQTSDFSSPFDGFPCDAKALARKGGLELALVHRWATPQISQDCSEVRKIKPKLGTFHERTSIQCKRLPLILILCLF